jgi:hypothetical protein
MNFQANKMVKIFVPLSQVFHSFQIWQVNAEMLKKTLEIKFESQCKKYQLTP